VKNVVQINYIQKWCLLGWELQILRRPSPWVNVIHSSVAGAGLQPPIGPREKKKKEGKRAFSAPTRFVCSDRGIE